MSRKDLERTNKLAEHLFRNFYQEVFSSLVVKFGVQHIELIEDAIQNTFYKALKSWKHNDYPKQPKGWLFVVTKNHIINELKRTSKNIAVKQDINSLDFEEIQLETSRDDQLQVLLACAKLDIKPLAKLIFTLKAICGFGVAEIANSLLISKESVYKIVQRGKQKLSQLPKDHFKYADSYKLTNEDIHYLQLVIYFMFNEGYDTINNSSKRAINKEICFEATRLAHSLEERQSNDTTQNLLSLFYFHMARFDTRISEFGEFVSLRKQNRSQWDAELIQLGFNYLQKPKQLNRYYLEALIASLHSTAPTFEETNWNDIIKLYNALLLLNDTPVIQLNKAICLLELGRNKEGLKILNALKDKLQENYLYYSLSMADYLADIDTALSKFWYEKSLLNAHQSFRKELIQQKMNETI